jgi:ubiquinone/menaquinone biosynthesis C-methylase UbiE
VDKQKEKEFFRKFAVCEYDTFTDEGYERLLREFEWLDPTQGEYCIDLGCGTGAFTEKLLRYGLSLSGIDISPEMICYARTAHPQIKFIIEDIENMKSIPSDYYDIAVFSGVLHHFADYSKAFKEAHRILAAGGKLFAYEPNKHNPIMWLYRDPKSPFCSKKGKTDNERLLRINDLKRDLTEQGFEAEVYAIGGVTFKYVESNLGKKLLPIYNIIEQITDKLPFANKIGSFIIVRAVKR